MPKYILCALIIFFNQTLLAETFFSWDCESNTTSVGPDVTSYLGSSELSTDTAHSGSKSLKLTIIGNDSGNQPLGAEIAEWVNLNRNVAGSGAIYYRWYMKIMSGFSWGAGTAKTKSSRVGGITEARIYTGYIYYNRVSIGECDESPYPDAGGCGPNDPPAKVDFDFTSMDDGLWHEYIVMVKPNTTINSEDAELRFWVDNVLIGTDTSGWKLEGDTNEMYESWGGWMVKPYFQLNGSESDGGTIYLDDFSTDSNFNSLMQGSVTLTGGTGSIGPNGTGSILIEN